MQLLELATRLDPELLDQDPPPFLVGVERLGLPARPIEGEHVLTAEPFPDWMLLDQTLELADKLGVMRSIQVGLDPLFERHEPNLFEMRDMGLSERLEDEVGQRRAAPEAESLSQSSRAFGRIPGSRALDQGTEPIEIQLAGPNVHPVTGRFGLEDLRSECLTQLRDEVLQRGDRGSRWLLAPECVDEPVDRDHTAGLEQQEGENGALLQAAEKDRTRLLIHLQRSEDSELRHVTFVTRFLSPE